VVAFVIAIIGTFGLMVNFGPGTPPPRTYVEDEGYIKKVKEYPEPKSVKEIKEDAEEKKDEYLKAQDRGADREKEEANSYVDQVLKRSEQMQK